MALRQSGAKQFLKAMMTQISICCTHATFEGNELKSKISRLVNIIQARERNAGVSTSWMNEAQSASRRN